MLLQNDFREISGHFSAVFEKRIFSQVILSVFFGQADACIATDYAFETLAKLNPQIHNKLKIIATSPPIINAVSVIRRNIDEDLRKAMMKMISDLGETADGRQVLLLFKIDRMAPLYESDLSSMEVLIKQHEELKFGKNRD